MKKVYRYKALKENGDVFEKFSTKNDIENWIESEIKNRGLDWRAGYLIRFRDRLQLEFVKTNGNIIKL